MTKSFLTTHLERRIAVVQSLNKVRRRLIKAGSLAAAIAVSQGFATQNTHALTVDGDLSDWGITVADNNGSVFNTVSAPGLGGFHIEDQDDNAGNGGFLGPNSGGQNYDGEFMGVARQGNQLHFAIVTGQRPDNGETHYSPGDLRITLAGGDVYGIEFGGGAYNADTGAAITEGDMGTTYSLNSNGYTQSGGVTNHGGSELAGSVWLNPAWILDPIAPQTEVQIDHALTLGGPVGMADYFYSRNEGVLGYYTGTQHAIIEGSIDLAFFGLSPLEVSQITSIQWHPSCGNDELIVNPTFPPGSPPPGTPEPITAAMGIISLGALSLTTRRRSTR